MSSCAAVLLAISALPLFLMLSLFLIPLLTALVPDLVPKSASSVSHAPQRDIIAPSSFGTSASASHPRSFGSSTNRWAPSSFGSFARAPPTSLADRARTAQSSFGNFRSLNGTQDTHSFFSPSS